MRTHCPWYAGCTPLMDLVIPSMGPGALLSTGLMRCPPTGRVRCGPGALPPTGQVHCFQRAACVAPDVPRTLIGRVRCPGCAGCVIPDVLGSLPLAYPPQAPTYRPQALTYRLHSPWHTRRIAVIGWLHCPDMRKPPFEMYRMVSKGGFRTEMALVMCFINGLKRTGCFQTAVFAHCTNALLVRKRLVGVSASCWCAGALPVCGARRAGQDEWCWV